MSENLFSYKRLLKLYLAWWLLWLLVHATLLHYAGWDWITASIDSGISNGFLAAACFATVNALRYYNPRRRNWQNTLLRGATLTAIWLGLINMSLSYCLAENPAYIAFLKQSLPIRYCIGFLMIGWVVQLTWLWRYISERREYEQRKAHTEELFKDAELANLRQQLQPHFLFNSLNSISALAGSKPEEARRMIQQLSDFLRGTLKKDEHQLVTLAEELQQLQLYLDIEKVRFGHRLNTVITCDEAIKKALLPALILQPVVENAIKFGLYDTLDAVAITLIASLKNNYLNLSIENPFDPATAQPRKGTGFGLSSVQRRLYLLYTRNDLLETNTAGNLFTTTVKIPQLA